jgi:hypothetical protein
VNRSIENFSLANLLHSHIPGTVSIYFGAISPYTDRTPKGALP